MENCFVTKYGVVINNPNLPVLETMQQFTLDVIAASGNSSMTDAQKWALNHFFYQIGAISNSGIYTKLKVLSLPFISTSVATALKNYAPNGSNYTNLSNLISFNNQGLVSSDANTSVCRYAIGGSLASDDIFFLSASGVGRSEIRILNSDNSEYIMNSVADGEINLKVTPYTTSSYILRSKNQTTLYENQINAVLLNNPDYLMLSANNSKIWQPETLYTTLSELKDSITISRFEPLAKNNDVLRAFTFGVGLTGDEATLFTTAIRDLYYNFISVS